MYLNDQAGFMHILGPKPTPTPTNTRPNKAVTNFEDCHVQLTHVQALVLDQTEAKGIRVVSFIIQFYLDTLSNIKISN